jgi:hypothetical protein
MNWSRRFDDPITMPDGWIIQTIGGAVEYAISLPKKIRNTEPWQRTARVLHEAAEHGGPFVFMARICFCKAAFGEDPAPIGNLEGKKGISGALRRPREPCQESL